MYILSQIFVFISAIFFILSVFSKSKIQILFWLIISDIFFATHYLLLGGFTGSYIVFTDILFLIISFILKKHKKEKAMFFVGIIFACASIVIGIFTWQGYISIFPMIGMTNYFVCMSINNLLVNKISLAINNTTNTIYMFLLQSYVGAIVNTVLVICSTIATIQLIIKKKKEPSNNIVSPVKKESTTSNLDS